MLFNFTARFFGALAQLYAISIFTNIHDEATTSAIILMFGYIVWFQLFEFGLTQTIQNKFNLRELNILNTATIIMMHYFFTVVLAILIFQFNLFSFLLLSNEKYFFTQDIKNNFDIGCSILIVMSNNLLVHRFLILYKKSFISNFLLFFQSILTFCLLYFYANFLKVDQLTSILIYFLPQLILSMPILILLIKKINKRKKKKLLSINFTTLIKYSSSFVFISFLSSFLLGLDYLILSYFSDSKELLSYHVTVRFFYFSFMLYFAYLTFSAKKISLSNKNYNFLQIKKIKQNSIAIGVFSVFSIYILVLILNQIGFINLITNGIKIDQAILFTAFVYFVLRVYADVRLVVAQNLSLRLNLIKLYFIQIVTSLIFMPVLSLFYGGTGVLIALIISYLMGFSIKLDEKKC